MILATKKHITVLILSVLLSGFSLASILNFTDPYAASFWIFLFFYISIFLLTFSFFSLTAFVIKRSLWPAMYVNDFSHSLRQGLILAIFLTLAIALQLNGILFWWLEISLLLLLITVEIYINIKD